MAAKTTTINQKMISEKMIVFVQSKQTYTLELKEER